MYSCVWWGSLVVVVVVLALEGESTMEMFRPVVSGERGRFVPTKDDEDVEVSALAERFIVFRGPQNYKQHEEREMFVSRNKKSVSTRQGALLWSHFKFKSCVVRRAMSDQGNVSMFIFERLCPRVSAI